MTAVTGPATAGQAGSPLSEGAREEAGSRHAVTQYEAVGRPLSTAPADTVTTAAQSVPPVVPAARRPYLAAVISDGSAPTSRTALNQVSRQVSAARLGGGRDSSDRSAPAPATAGGAGTKPVGRAPSGLQKVASAGPPSDSGEPASAALVEGGPECAAVAYADGLDGSERKVLMHHIAQAWPEVVEAGVELVAQWRAECAEQRRQRDRRREHDRRRRRAAEAGDSR